jgi:hypothetical protein
VLGGLRAGPVVVAQLAHRGRGVVRNRVELQLSQLGDVVVSAGQLVPLRGQRLIQQLADAIQRAAEVTASLSFAQPFAHLPTQLVQPCRRRVPGAAATAARRAG